MVIWEARFFISKHPWTGKTDSLIFQIDQEQVVFGSKVAKRFCWKGGCGLLHRSSPEGLVLSLWGSNLKHQ